MIERLTKIGLSENQARVYLAVLKLGECSVGPLEKELGLFKQSIYNILDELIDKKLIEVKVKNNRKYFVTVDPDVLLDQHISRGRAIEKLIPELHTLEGIDKYISDIKIYSGVKAFQIFHEKMLKQSPESSQLDIIASGGDEFLKITRQRYFFDRYESLRINKKIHHNILLYESQRQTDREYLERRYVKVKFLPGNLTQPMATQIWPSLVAILLFGQDPQIVEIKSKKIRDGFKNYFDVLWEMGKE